MLFMDVIFATKTVMLSLVLLRCADTSKNLVLVKKDFLLIRKVLSDRDAF